MTTSTPAGRVCAGFSVSAALCLFLASQLQAGWTKYVPSIPVERDQPGMAFDKVRGEIVLFGGNNSNPPQKRNDTWVWNGTHWVEKSPASKPSQRLLVAMAFDEVRGNVVLFGGFDSADPNGGQLGDTWVWDGINWIEQTPSALPPARYGAGMAYDPVTQTILLFGGSGDAGDLNDTWSWNGTTWTELHPATSPPARLYPAMSSDPARNAVLLFGGFNFFNGGSLNDTWSWNGATWTQQLPLTPPPGRSFAGMAPDPTGNVVLFGGAISVQNLADTWTWNGTNWTLRTTTSSPEARAGFGLAYDADRNWVILFGGRSGVGLSVSYREDTWSWNGVQWAEVQLSVPPPPRSEAGMAYDATRDEVLLFGGWNGLQSLDDTWIWKDGWKKREPVLSPAERSLHGTAFDEERAEAVVYGGFSNGARLSDTWTWNGTAWTARTPLISPPGRYGGAMVYDAARKKVVLFGGSALTGYQNDTWTWDGTNWTQQNPATAPPPRYRPGIGYHAASGKVVLFGGFDSAFNLLGDTWTWNGTNWTEEHPSQKPSLRYSATLSDTRGSDRLVLFGGSDGGVNITSDLDDTWTWNGANWKNEAPALHPDRSFSANMVYETTRKRVLYFGGANLEKGAMRETWAWTLAPPVTNVISQKIHAARGAFDIELSLVGPPGVECRSAGVNGIHKLIFTFANPLTSVGQASLTSGNGMVSSSGLAADPHQFIVNLAGVSNEQRILVMLSAMTDGVSNGDIILPMLLVEGDTNADSRVNVGDTNQTKSRSGQLTNGANKRSDVNLDGRINVGDTNFVKARSGDSVGQ